MIKIDSELLVCTASASQRLIDLGIISCAALCYERNEKECSYEYAGEYCGQDNAIPAWTIGELHILIGGEFPKPDIRQEWERMANMIEYLMFLPKKMKTFSNGAEAGAAFLEHIMHSGLVTAEDCNARLISFYQGRRHNPASVKLDQIQSEK